MIPKMILLHYFSTMPAYDDQVIYETDDKGESVVVKSTRSDKRAYVRFVNKTSRPVEVSWRDYNGHRRHYVTIKPRSYYNADTFVTHPWEFSDANTKERYLINNKYVFRAPDCLANMKHRTTWYISIPPRSLLSTAMLSIASKFLDADKVDELGLPKQLAEDLKTLVDMLNTIPARARVRV